jgi:hypothetical protein
MAHTPSNGASVTQLQSAPRRDVSDPHDHLVQFYESDDFLCERVASFLCAGVRQGEPVVIVATGDHRSDRFLSRSAEFEHHLVKPLALEALAAVMDEIDGHKFARS